MNMQALMTVTISSILTIMVLSYVWKDSILFRFCDYLFVGLAFATVGATGAIVIMNTAILPATKGNFLGIPGLILGLLMFSRFSKNLSYMSRWPLALLMGVGAGISLGGTVQTQVTAQIQAMAEISQYVRAAGNPAAFIGEVVTLVFAVCSILFFIFTIKQTGALSLPSKIGRLALMITFGAGYGMTVTGRYALLTDSLILIIRDWIMTGLLGMKTG